MNDGKEVECYKMFRQTGYLPRYCNQENDMFGLDALLGIGNKLIDKLIPDPQAKAQAQMELAKMQQTGELAQL